MCREAAGIVLAMIANAINADSRWFWHGPDASGNIGRI
jgi:hypothetical protein